MKQVTTERRVTARFAVQLTIRYRGMGLKGFGRSGNGLVTNISEGGLLVGVASSRVIRGMKLMVELEHGEIEGSCQLPGVVERVNTMGFAVSCGAVDQAQRRLLNRLLENAAEKEGREGEIPENSPPVEASPIDPKSWSP